MFAKVFKNKVTPLLLALVTCSLATANADVIRLKDGRELQGEVEDNGSTVKLKTALGSITIDRSQIVSWDRGSASALGQVDKVSEFKRLEGLLGSGTAEERYRLAVWARSNRLQAKAKACFESVLNVDPDHPGARAALGYKQLNGSWLIERDYYKLKGMVKFRGQWITVTERAKLLAESKSERKVKKLERELAALKRAVKRQEQRAARDRRRRAQSNSTQTPYNLSLGIQPASNFYGPGFPNQSVFNSYYGGYYFGYPWDIYRQFNGVLPWRPIIINNPIVGQGSSRQRVLPYGGNNNHRNFGAYPFSSNYYRRGWNNGGLSFDWRSKSGRTRISGSFGPVGRKGPRSAYRGQHRHANPAPRTQDRRTQSSGRIRQTPQSSRQRSTANATRLINSGRTNRVRATPQPRQSTSARSTANATRLINSGKR